MRHGARQEREFDVVSIGTPDGEQLMTAIDNLIAQGAQGFVVCPPDVRLGPAVVARAKAAGLKFMTVDDQFVKADGKPMTEVPHLGMSGYQIGRQAGDAIAAEMRLRGWDPLDVGALAITNNELPTAVERVSGARDALSAAGLAASNFFEAPQRATDTGSASNAATPVFSRNPNVRRRVIFALNEDGVLGAVRASEQFGLFADQVIGVGIGGSASAIAEFSKAKPTGFFATVAVSSAARGRQSALDVYAWISKGKTPPNITHTTGTLMTRKNWRRLKSELRL